MIFSPTYSSILGVHSPLSFHGPLKNMDPDAQIDVIGTSSIPLNRIGAFAIGKAVQIQIEPIKRIARAVFFIDVRAIQILN